MSGHVRRLGFRGLASRSFHPRGAQRVGQQTGDGHRPDAARDRGDRTGDLHRLVERDIAD